MIKTTSGYEYEEVGMCPKTKRPVVAPIVWNGQGARPSYATCICCAKRQS